MSELTVGNVGWSPDFKAAMDNWPTVVDTRYREHLYLRSTVEEELVKLFVRAPDADRDALRGLVRELRECCLMTQGFTRSEFNELIARADKALAREPGERTYSIAEVRAAWIENAYQLCRYLHYDWSDKLDAWVRSEAQRLYPDKPQEGKP
jgi:hypothetical protein